jgi:hypothetical protein
MVVNKYRVKGFFSENQYYAQIDRNEGSEYAEIMKMMIN